MNKISAGSAFRNLASATAKMPTDVEELKTAAGAVLSARTDLLLAIQRLLDCPDLQFENLQEQSILAKRIADRLIYTFDQAKASKGETALGLRLLLKLEQCGSK